MAKRDCKRCGGTGWIVAEQEGISAADRCTCVAESRAEELEERAQIPRNYGNASFENFILPADNPIAEKELAKAMARVNGYIREFPAGVEKPGLLLVGPPGTGKTHLAVVALRKLLARGHEGIFFDYQNLLDRIRSGYNEALGASDREAYKIALETEILLLDDLGAHRVTEWVQDTVTSIVTYRCNHKKPLIATTNLPDPDIAGTMDHSERITLEDRIGSRARSRIFEMCLVVRMPAVADHRVKASDIR